LNNVSVDTVCSCTEIKAKHNIPTDQWKILHCDLVCDHWNWCNMKAF